MKFLLFTNPHPLPPSKQIQIIWISNSNQIPALKPDNEHLAAAILAEILRWRG